MFLIERIYLNLPREKIFIFKFHALQRQMDRYAGKVTGCHPLLPDKGVGQRQAVIALK